MISHDEAGAILLAMAAEGRTVAVDAPIACPCCLAARMRRLLELAPHMEDPIQTALQELSRKTEVFREARKVLLSVDSRRSRKRGGF